MPRGIAVTSSVPSGVAGWELDVEVGSDERGGLTTPVGLSVLGVEPVTRVALAGSAAALAVQLDDLAG